MLVFPLKMTKGYPVLCAQRATHGLHEKDELEVFQLAVHRSHHIELLSGHEHQVVLEGGHVAQQSHEDEAAKDLRERSLDPAATVEVAAIAARMISSECRILLPVRKIVTALSAKGGISNAHTSSAPSRLISWESLSH